MRTIGSESGHPLRSAQHWNTGIDTNEKKKKKGKRKSQAKYRKEEKGKTYIK
jgi:hypothetical protein